LAKFSAHNHPAGNPEPSREDMLITEQIVETGRVLDIRVAYHVIVGDGKYVSMKERGFV
jgi:DNA repair protein RadC